jgi:IS5 family transposase
MAPRKGAATITANRGRGVAPLPAADEEGRAAGADGHEHPDFGRDRLTPHLSVIVPFTCRAMTGPMIGQMKDAGPLTRCPLKGTGGDARSPALCGCGHDIRMILRYPRAVFPG